MADLASGIIEPSSALQDRIIDLPAGHALHFHAIGGSRGEARLFFHGSNRTQTGEVPDLTVTFADGPDPNGEEEDPPSGWGSSGTFRAQPWPSTVRVHAVTGRVAWVRVPAGFEGRPINFPDL